MSKIFVVSGNYHEYSEWRKKNRDRAERLSDIIYVSNVTVFRGFGEVHGVFIGTFNTRPDLANILWEIRRINRIDPSQSIIPSWNK